MSSLNIFTGAANCLLGEAATVLLLFMQKYNIDYVVVVVILLTGHGSLQVLPPANHAFCFLRYSSPTWFLGAEADTGACPLRDLL